MEAVEQMWLPNDLICDIDHYKCLLKLNWSTLRNVWKVHLMWGRIKVLRTTNFFPSEYLHMSVDKLV